MWKDKAILLVCSCIVGSLNFIGLNFNNKFEYLFGGGDHNPFFVLLQVVTKSDDYIHSDIDYGDEIWIDDQ